MSAFPCFRPFAHACPQIRFRFRGFAHAHSAINEISSQSCAYRHIASTFAYLNRSRIPRSKTFAFLFSSLPAPNSPQKSRRGFRFAVTAAPHPSRAPSARGMEKRSGFSFGKGSGENPSFFSKKEGFSSENHSLFPLKIHSLFPSTAISISIVISVSASGFAA